MIYKRAHMRSKPQILEFAWLPTRNSIALESSFIAVSYTHLFRIHPHAQRQPGMLAQMLLLAMDRDKIFRLADPKHQLLLLLAGMAGNCLLYTSRCV